MRINLQKAVVLYLAWLGTLAGAVLVLLAEILPFRLTFVRPGNLFACLLECQLFFVVFVWPLLLPWLLREDAAASGAPAGPGWVLLQGAALAVLAFPLALVGANVSNVGLAALLAAEVRVAAAAALVASVFLAGAARKRRVAPAYFLAAFALSAVPPFLHFLAHERGAGSDLSFLTWVSPFWGALELDAAAWGQAAVFAAAAAATLLAGAKARGPAPEPSSPPPS